MVESCLQARCGRQRRIYDPQGNSFSSVGANLDSPRAFHGAALLKDGTILIVGGTAADGSRCNPARSSTSVTLLLCRRKSDGRPHVSATLRVLHDGKVQIIGVRITMIWRLRSGD